jgi:hypothetical protein
MAVLKILPGSLFKTQSVFMHPPGGMNESLSKLVSIAKIPALIPR